MIGTESKVRRNPNVVARDLAEEEGGVLLHLVSGEYHGVNPVGLAIWELLEEERTVGDVVTGLRARVEDPPPQLEADVLRFLQQVHERDLVVLVG